MLLFAGLLIVVKPIGYGHGFRKTSDRLHDASCVVSQLLLSVEKRQWLTSKGLQQKTPPKSSSG